MEADGRGTADKLRNVELKAKIHGEDAFAHRVAIAKKLTGTDGTVITQNDVFFNASKGRLKLRYLTHKKSELISYDRPDVTGPKLSLYSKMDIDEPECLEQILSETIGVRGKLDKKRLLFLHDQTRIHLDAVASLGHFLEFEVVLRPEQTIEEGQAVVAEMKRLFEISDEDLMTGAYIDQLLK
uniref:CYTH domain-containing protein n=1 Tax=Anopheles culicifacies TaxID=139723 RepID=A0A182MDM1_9DIPT